jgi:hypothetical protein
MRADIEEMNRMGDGAKGKSAAFYMLRSHKLLE